jgi:hypothetical protein
MDIDQSARRQARDEFQVIDPDYYDMEGKIRYVYENNNKKG